MAIAPQAAVGGWLQGFLRLSNSQKVGLMVGAAASIAIVAALWIWASTPSYRVLYSNISDRDGGPIISALQQLNIPYRMSDGGGAILVPAEQVHETRLRLAGQGLPKGGAVGFELMENQKLGISQFLEQVNYQRALEGELARSIMSLSSVAGARVHLAIPRQTVFVREQQKPSASVLVSLHGGRALDAAQVAAIVHLVSSSVPDLSPRAVTVVDEQGTLLAGAGDSGAGLAGLEPAQLKYLQQVEKGYADRVRDIVAAMVGPGNVRVQVTADLDFSQTEQTAEKFAPNGNPTEAAIRSQQTSEASGAGQGPSGIPGALSNQPPGAATAPLVAPGQAPGQAGAAQPTGSSSRQSTVNYELDKTVRRTRMAVGTVKRLSAAVLVNYRSAKDKDGKDVSTPLTPQELAQINELAREAMGFSAQRGDTVNVVNASFATEAKEVVEKVPFYLDKGNLPLVLRALEILAAVGITLFLVLGVLRPYLRDMVRAARTAAAAPPVLPEAGMAAVSQAAAAASDQDAMKAARDMAREDPKVVANIVRDWVSKE